MTTVLEKIALYQYKLEKYARSENEGKVLHYLNELGNLDVTISHLEKTGVGMSVNALKAKPGKVSDRARSLVNKWKEVVELAECLSEQSEYMPEQSSYRYSSNETQNIAEATNSYESIEYNYVNDDSDALEIEENSPSDYKANENVESGEKPENVYNPYTSKSYYLSVTNPYYHNNGTTFSSDCNNDTKSCHSLSNQANELPLHSTTDQDSVEKEDEKSSCKSLSHKRHNNYSHRKHKKHSRDKEESHKKHKSIKVEKKSKKMHNQSSYENSLDIVNCDIEGQSSHNNVADSFDKKSRTHKSSNKSHSSKENKKNHHKKSKSSYEMHKNNRDNEIHLNLSNDKDKLKESTYNFKASEEFGQALLGESSSKKKKKKQKETLKESSFVSSPAEQNDENSFNGIKKYKNGKPGSLLMPAFSASIEDSLLPEISPIYKPLPRYPKKDESFIFSQPKIEVDDTLSSMYLSKTSRRSQMYSGKLNFISDYVPSLFELCIKLLQDNIDCIEEVGIASYDILLPVLERATPKQLARIEYFNPHLMEDTNELWKSHCQKEFAIVKRENMELWREAYFRFQSENDKKLADLTENLKQKYFPKLPAKRTVQLAFVDCAVKPPKSVARAQAKNGTGGMVPPKLKGIARDGKLKPAVSHTEKFTPNPRQAMVKKQKAPLMMKTLQFYKKTFRR